MGMQLIETIELTGTAAIIDFASIPQDGIDLLLLVSLRGSVTSATYANTNIVVNSDAASQTVPAIRFYGTGSGVVSDTFAPGYIVGNWVPAATSTSNTFSSGQWYISNYSGSGYKSISADVVTENYANSAIAGLGSAQYNNTAAITHLRITSETFVAGSTASLYKITAD